ncbi:hypothetical protein IFM89_039110 [Coptis chinensis]|uniref:Uncharacterized protein n=1 Tax=Coptis chinensis TaxID=261450 RepID=A0A835MBP7_9MAGN|nr:hypothetical protein IFM89_039110 [Coptis chinensis]
MGPFPRRLGSSLHFRIVVEFEFFQRDLASRTTLGLGIDKLADAVGVTLGPRGRNVVLDEYGSPKVVNDRVTIARQLNLRSYGKCRRAALIREELIRLSEGLVAELEKKARSIEGRDDVKAAATISAGNDEDIGIMIADAIDKVRADGVLSIESSLSFETTVDVEEGMEIDRGAEFQAGDPGLMIENTEVEQLGIARKSAENCQVVGGVAVIKRKGSFTVVVFALVHLSMFVPAIKEKFDDADEWLGADIVQKALVAPRIFNSPQCRC